MTHDHHHGSTVVERDSSSAIIVAVVVILLAVFLIWAIFFSGWIVDADEDEGGVTDIDQEQEGDDVDVIDPDDEGGTQDSPAEPSP